MRKLSVPEIALETPPRSKRRRAVSAILLALMLAPLVFESTALCAARWRMMYGPVVAVQTPVLDTVAAGFHCIYSGVNDTTSGMFRRLPWRPSLVIPLACTWALCCTLLFRRS
jgi:hypothetical protein